MYKPSKQTRKILLYLGVCVFVVGVFWGGADIAWAQLLPSPGQQTTTDATLQEEIIVGLELILKLLHLVMWPLLAIAGASMDNSLIYGSLFYLDRALWKFWHIMRTFANFTIGFVLLWTILKYILNGAAISSIVKKIGALFAGVILVNASWWIMAVLIDFSTVMTVNFGALPLVVVGQDQNEETNPLRKTRYLKIHSFFNLDATANEELDESQHAVVYSCGETKAPVVTNMYYLPCQFNQGMWIEKGLVDQPGNWLNYKQGVIDSWGLIDGGSMLTQSNIDDEFCVHGYDLIKNRFGDPLSPENFTAAQLSGQAEMVRMQCVTLDGLLSAAEGLAGPMYTLFASILNMGTNSLNSNSDSITEAGLEFFVRSVVGIALMLPLFALAVVMVVRAVLLWVIIAFSPILFLLYAYNAGFDKKVSGGSGKVQDAQQFSNVLSLIFLPVYAVFAISISIVFLTLLGRIDLIEEDQQVDPMVLLGAEKSDDSPDYNCYSILGLTEICHTEATSRAGTNLGNIMSRLVVNGFGIALMWTVIFFALKSSKMTQGIAETVQKVGETAMMNTKFISIGGQNMSLAGLAESPRELQQQMQSRGRVNNEASSGIDNQVSNSTELVKNQTAAWERAIGNNKVQPDDLQVAAGTEIAEYDANKIKQLQTAGAKQQAFPDTPQGELTYMAANNLHDPDRWVKVNSESAQKSKTAYARNAESQYKSQGPSSLLYSQQGQGFDQNWYRASAEHEDGTTTSTVTTFTYRGNQIESVKSYRIQSAPTSVEDRNSFSSLVNQADTQWSTFKDNPKLKAMFAGYISIIDAAMDGSAPPVTIDGANYTVEVQQSGDKVTGVTLNKVTN